MQPLLFAQMSYRKSLHEAYFCGTSREQGAGHPGDNHDTMKIRPTETMNRPNILFLLVDCLRSDALFASDRRAITPTLDLLREAGTAFTQMVASASSTTPCVASLLTSTYSFTHGVRSIFGLKLNPAVQSLIECFRDEGYFTFAEVTGPLFPETGLDKGFDDYRFREGTEYLSTSWGTDFRSRISKKTARPWFCFLHLWELHHNRLLKMHKPY